MTFTRVVVSLIPFIWLILLFPLWDRYILDVFFWCVNVIWLIWRIFSLLSLWVLSGKSFGVWGIVLRGWVHSELTVPELTCNRHNKLFVCLSVCHVADYFVVDPGHTVQPIKTIGLSVSLETLYSKYSYIVLELVRLIHPVTSSCSPKFEGERVMVAVKHNFFMYFIDSCVKTVQNI